MIAFEVTDLQSARVNSGRLYHEFLRVASMSAGLYHLETGRDDPQGPHNEDELYYVVRGRGKIRVADEDRDVQPGSMVFVAAHAEHRFHSITEDMNILVFFAPAET
jgi:mannose-6-phosphate isomerase-like protein (cupin superfamily)